MNKRLFLFLCILGLSTVASAQQVTLTPDQLKALTPEWTGERSADGRPRVSDALLQRLKKVGLEDTWVLLRNKGYQNQFEGEWMVIHPDSVMNGRVVTAQYYPMRPDLDKLIKEKGKAEGRIGNTNSWPIDVLKDGDIYVADGFGKVVDGTLIGDNLGNAIYAHSHRGVIFYGYVRDVVLAKKGGVVFIPAHLVDYVVLNAEFIGLRDEFGHMRLRQGKYTPGQIDAQWSDEIKKDFLRWLEENPGKVSMSRAELDQFIKDRTW